MGKLLGRSAIALAILAMLSLGLSNVLLSGEDPAGWWNFIPAYVFYATTLVLIPLLGVVALVALAASGVRKYSCR